MGPDGGTRPLPRPDVPQGPLRDLKDAVYELYLAAYPISLDAIHTRIHSLDIDPTPDRTAIGDVISGDSLPADARDVVAVVAALLQPRLGPGVRGHPEVERIRTLWAQAAGQRPLGRPVLAVSPGDLEVHVANLSPDNDTLPELPPYVVRPGDRAIQRAVDQVRAGRSEMVVLVSDSTSGKTRACYEALRWAPDAGTESLADSGWSVWPPISPVDVTTFLRDLPSVGARTVVWLNEVQRYLVEPAAPLARQVADGLRELLASRARGPVLVLGTLWPDLWSQLTRRPQSGEPDTFASARLLLDGRGIPWPDTFTDEEQQAARDTGDPRLVEAADHAEGGAVTQFLAGVPDLMQRYRLAAPPVRAVIHAAMDARRLGHGEWLPAALLSHAAPSYLDSRELRKVERTPNWFADTVYELTRLGDADTSVLTADGHDRYRLEGYLDQHGRRTRISLVPPQGFWDACVECSARPDDLAGLAKSAQRRHRLRIAAALCTKASHTGHPYASMMLAEILVESGHGVADEQRYREAAAAGHPYALLFLAETRERAGDHWGAELVAEQAAQLGDPHTMAMLAMMRRKAGDVESADRLAAHASDAGYVSAVVDLVEQRERDGDHDGAERIALNAARNGRLAALMRLVEMRERAGAQEDAERLAHYAADARHPIALANLAMMRERAGDQEDAERLAHMSLRGGPPTALTNLARMRERAGDRPAAERIAEQAARAGHPDTLAMLAEMRAESGDHAEAQRLTERAARAGHPDTLATLGMMREQVGDSRGAEELYRRALDAGHTEALTNLAIIRERAGDREEAEDLALQATRAGHPDTLATLGMMREQVGDSRGAEELYRRALDAGHTEALTNLAIIRERAGDREEAESLAHQSLRDGSPAAFSNLARMRARAGDHEDAERLADQALRAGHPDTLAMLAVMREQTGDRDAAERLARRAADAGRSYALIRMAMTRPADPTWAHVKQFGLDADGAMSDAW
ncbi:tetratricopeptide repeat protein [Actinocrispum wychmicini]|uniref:TPR repeat protein n=1 Tax=Actinocrispum wychmicini TaxID=1213861 RepID=A0A4R2JU27_9PSEU|nr:tetratricopeptide repeat protein [Actinocrispum wychmicini]TCO60766.1 TPR repeat protein [Actinocrispum wychmicini]